MIAVITGSTGLVGSVLIQKLLLDRDFSLVISLSRRPIGIQSQKLKEVIVTDFSELHRYQDELKGDLYYCCIGTTIKIAGTKEKFRNVDHDAVVAFAKMAVQNHAKSFSVISAKGANANSMIFYNRVKGEMERDLKALDLKSLIIMHPGLLLGERAEFRLGEKMALMTAKIIPKKLQKPIATDVNELAQRMLTESKLSRSGATIIEAQNI